MNSVPSKEEAILCNLVVITKPLIMICVLSLSCQCPEKLLYSWHSKVGAWFHNVTLGNQLHKNGIMMSIGLKNHTWG